MRILWGSAPLKRFSNLDEGSIFPEVGHKSPFRLEFGI
jgi:hypothetical protein